MRRQLELLMDLQNLDNEIISIELERDKIPGQLEVLETEIKGKRKELQEQEKGLAGLETAREQKRREQELERLKLKNTRNKETAIQNIKQYEAYVKEIETQEKSAEELNEELDEIIEKINKFEAERDRAQGLVKDVEVKIGDLKREMERDVVDYEKKLDLLYNRRDDLAGEVKKHIFEKYESIAELRDGIAVAYAQKKGGQEGHCTACHMSLPPQQFNEIMSMNHLHSCPGCSRILVYREVPESEIEVEDKKPKKPKKKVAPKKAVASTAVKKKAKTVKTTDKVVAKKKKKVDDDDADFDDELDAEDDHEVEEVEEDEYGGEFDHDHEYDRTFDRNFDLDDE